MSDVLQKKLGRGIELLELALPSGTQEKLLAYLDLLLKWNAAYNLTAIRDAEQMVVKHLLDSLSILPSLNGGTLIDVGTGAGLPGFVVALARPETHVTLLDSNGKKVRFLRQAIAELGVKNADAVQSRVEDFDRTFSVVTSRAFATLADMIEGSQQLLAEDGEFLAMKGQAPTEEIAALPAGFMMRELLPVRVPFLDEERHLVRIVRT
ncbi:MAG: 16S rRNA (guanine(527)-N(7))-methyltransferase RsmG [Hydrogenophaga sp.]|uniref:16S rRNA (guanine(527)-N(7))-methyltransferase RsmG n=1 Tax=Hydrogenophaga sp. TaxID=1904254 RepID=UPI00272FE25D|nr:16S rRNA (guanine(527)-N(7))-methyltransferase RsmG [Hydrogenophaga sp.]MDP2166619.1 16S rRNA (guanine(527)-N(7))-methyltransferase RsmG [Hydrogenophaga sp.]